MNPHVQIISEDDNTLKFTLSGVNVSIANAVRRTIMSDIPTVVFKTSHYEENKANITVNTTRLNNEILKQRLSCIPIHIVDLEKMPLNTLLVEVNVENLTDTIRFVTTEDFKIKNLATGEYLSDNNTREIFPPNEMTGYFIDFARLRPKISDELPGEKLSFTCELSIATAKQDGMFNVVSTCAYGFTQNYTEIEEILGKQAQQWKDKGMTTVEIEFEKSNWRLLDAQRVVVRDSFDFTIETLGVFSNNAIIHKACDILIQKLTDLDTSNDTDELQIYPSDNTMKNSYDIILVNEDYTIGKVIEFCLYAKFFEGLKTLSFCGFKKMHPHDTDSIIRVAYKDATEKITIKQNLKDCITDSIVVYNKIKDKFPSI